METAMIYWGHIEIMLLCKSKKIKGFLLEDPSDQCVTIPRAICDSDNSLLLEDLPSHPYPQSRSRATVAGLLTLLD